MLKNLFVLIILMSSYFYGDAQDSTKLGSITGQVEDTSYHVSMSGAKITLTKYNDSLPFQTTYLKTDGTFSFEKLPLDSFWVRVTFPGYSGMKQKATLSSDMPNYPLSTFYMAMTTNSLEDVVVVSTPPISFKGDTTDLRADAFHTKPNATAEDLLKKMPGFEIDASGNIQAQGESVTRVLVNGKRFFDGDPKMATQNLPKDIIEKIQVYDAQSDQSAFSGFDDGNRTKTINIVIKKDKNVGYFGKQTAGVGRGNQNFYNVGGNINRFNNDQKISVLGQINNVNSQMFTMQDLGGGNGRNAGGGRGAGSSGTFGGSSAGITKTIAGGLRYADKWGNTDVDGSYFYTNSRTNNDGHSERQNLYSDTANNTNQYDTTATLSTNINHRVQFNIDSKLDSNNSLLIRPNMSFITSDNKNGQITDIFKNNSDGSRNYLTKSNINSYSHNTGFNGTGSALYMHRFHKAGRTISFEADWTGSQNNGYSYNTNIIDYLSTNITDSINRYYKTISNSNTLGGTVTYTEPIAKNQQLSLTYNHSYSKSVADQTVYNYNNATSAYTELDSSLTNSFNNNYNSDRVELGYHYNNKVINFSAGNGVQFGNFNSINSSKGYEIHRNYTNLYPTASFRWNIAQAQRLNFDYNGRTAQPSATQLQPVLDNSNELAQTIGNPDLKQSFTHTFRLRYFFFDRKNNKHLFTMLNYSLTNNYIANVTTQLSSGGQRTSYQNMNGYYSINGNFDYGFPILKPQSNLSLRTAISASSTPSLIIDSSSSVANIATNSTKNYTFGERIGWTTNLASTFDVNISTEPSYTIAKYSVNKSSNNNYYSQQNIVEATWYTESGWQVNTTFNYTFYTGLYNTSVPLLNAYVSKSLFKNKAGEIRFSVYDLLNQNKAVTNTRTGNYAQTSTNTVLKRYAMISFVYNLKNFGKNGNKGQRRGFRDRGDMPDGPPPGGGMGGGFGGPPPGGGMGGPSAAM
ncbi:outer membrane beta-barrel protein [Rhizosphaericola mali]|uniref:Outer membrane beta-barrel protein n=1 Tax=Rhizosphaericola mali TaxID=2545455 RepID=A0A5P2G9M6_9BACT|nr:outer membrane beta-barrel protein [Rhizosphaericola mali]